MKPSSQELTSCAVIGAAPFVAGWGCGGGAKAAVAAGVGPSGTDGRAEWRCASTATPKMARTATSRMLKDRMASLPLCPRLSAPALSTLRENTILNGKLSIHGGSPRRLGSIHLRVFILGPLCLSRESGTMGHSPLN